MKPGKIIALILVLLFTLTVMVVGGQFAGGAFVLSRFGLDIKTVEFNTLYTYYTFYGDSHKNISNVIKLGWAISAVPVAIVLFTGIIAAVVRKPKIDDLYGHAQFATANEIAKANMFLDEKKKNKWPPVILGKAGKRYIADYSQEYTSLAAKPGAGKGVSFVIPNLLYYQHSVICFDPKAENFRITSGYRKSVLGQDVYLFTPDNTDDVRAEDGASVGAEQSLPADVTHCWNPLDYISSDPRRSLFDIKTLTSIVIDAPDGQNQGFYLDARKALDGILLYLMETPEEERTMYNAGVINDNPAGFENWALKTISNRERAGRPLSDQCIRLLMSYANETEKKRDTTRGIVSTALDPFSDPYSRAATQRSDFSFYDLRKKPMTIYVAISPGNIPKFRKMLNLFFAQAITVNTSVLPEDGPKDANGEPVLKYQCLALLDEFVALGPIEIIRASSGYTRAYNMRYAIVFQNLAQVFAEQSYGKSGGQSLLGTIHNEIVFATDEVDEAKGYSDRLGTTTLKHRERNRSRNIGTAGGSTTDNTQRYSRALMLPQEIQQMPYEEQLIFKKSGRINPIRCNKVVWYQDPNFKDKANLPTPVIPRMDFQV